MPFVLTDGRNGLALIPKEYEGATLMHYRTKNSKNGVRLYQNLDGSLTPLGRIHYGVGQKRKTSDEDESQSAKAYLKKMQGGAKTASEYDFTKDSMYNCLDDEKAMDSLRKTFDLIPNTTGVRDLAKEFAQSVTDLDNAWTEYGKKWGLDHPGKAWDGDGTEFHWELEKRYPEYNKISKTSEKFSEQLVDRCIEIAKDMDVPEFDKYKNYFDKIIDPKTKEPWYKIGDVKAYAIAIMLSGEEAKYNLFPESFIKAYDSAGKLIK